MTEERDMKNFVVVTATSGESLVGFTKDRGDFKNKVGRKELVSLHQVRAFVNERFPKPAPGGGITLDSFCAFLPLGVFRGPATTVRVHVASYYFPTEQNDERLVGKLTELLDAAEVSEMALSAADAGLHLPGLPR